jgi:hypothetical protein
MKLTTSLPSVSQAPRQCGIFNISQPYRSPQPVMGTELLSLLVIKTMSLQLSFYFIYAQNHQNFLCGLWGQTWSNVSYMGENQQMGIRQVIHEDKRNHMKYDTSTHCNNPANDVTANFTVLISSWITYCTLNLTRFFKITFLRKNFIPTFNYHAHLHQALVHTVRNTLPEQATGYHEELGRVSTRKQSNFN